MVPYLEVAELPVVAVAPREVEVVAVLRTVVVEVEVGREAVVVEVVPP